MTPRLENILYYTSACLVAVLMSTWFAFAAEPKTASTLVCSTQMSTKGLEHLVTYQNLLNEFFLADKETHLQIAEAQEFFRTFETEVQKIFETYSVPTVAGTQDDATNDRLTCAFYRDQLVRYAQVSLKAHTLGSANSKRTFKFRDGLDIINADLEDFSKVYFETFPTIFTRMDSALPCYVKQCL